MRVFLKILSLLLIPHLLFFVSSPQKTKSKISLDIDCWKKRKNHVNYGSIDAFVWLLLKYPEFRTLFYHRIGKLKSFFCRYFPGRMNLFIMTPADCIGGGLYIGHGWGTVLNAASVGENCMIAQNVTIGSRNLKEPVLQDCVSVWAHAVIVGGVTIGAHSSIGAGAVVVKDVPSKSVVVPAKSCIIKIDGVKCHVEL